MQTHEMYIQAVAAIVCKQLSEADRAKVCNIKLAYGAGQSGLRGVTYYNKWGKPDGNVPFVEVCAFGQESLVQLAGTTIHELGHVLAGWDAGHGPEWKAACGKLGLRRVKQTGTEYKWVMFAPAIREAIANLPKPDDGAPVAGLAAYIGKRKVSPKPCGAGIGTRGGKSRGAGSGSRLRLFECECLPPIKVRVARDEFDCDCNTCHRTFIRR